MSDKSPLFHDQPTRDLVKAAERGDIDGVRAAIRAGANPNAHGEEQLTPLMAVLGTTTSKAGLSALLGAGADPNEPSTQNTSPIELAAQAPDPDFLRIMLARGGNANLRTSDGKPLIWVAAVPNQFANVQKLLDSGADINATNASGFTTVMNMAMLRRFDRVAWFIERGADVKRQSKGHVTLLDLVLHAPPTNPIQETWRSQVYRMLVERGVTVPVTSNKP